MFCYMNGRLLNSGIYLLEVGTILTRHHLLYSTPKQSELIETHLVGAPKGSVEYFFLVLAWAGE
jgi:hypothetical protein